MLFFNANGIEMIFRYFTEMIYIYFTVMIHIYYSEVASDNNYKMLNETSELNKIILCILLDKTLCKRSFLKLMYNYNFFIALRRYLCYCAPN